MKFRKKPVVIEAFRWEIDQWPSWASEAAAKSELVGTIDSKTLERVLWVKTLEGGHTASRGDWIIRGVKGELYPCKPDIFAMTYDAVTE